MLGFLFLQDMCVVCGSFGRGAEGHLLACSQCSQCYHPYCVNSKVSSGPGMCGQWVESVLYYPNPPHYLFHYFMTFIYLVGEGGTHMSGYNC